jgi:hypothetical protein
MKRMGPNPALLFSMSFGGGGAPPSFGELFAFIVLYNHKTAQLTGKGSFIEMLHIEMIQRREFDQLLLDGKIRAGKEMKLDEQTRIMVKETFVAGSQGPLDKSIRMMVTAHYGPTIGDSRIQCIGISPP